MVGGANERGDMFVRCPSRHSFVVGRWRFQLRDSSFRRSSPPFPPPPSTPPPIPRLDARFTSSASAWSSTTMPTRSRTPRRGERTMCRMGVCGRRGRCGGRRGRVEMSVRGGGHDVRYIGTSSGGTRDDGDNAAANIVIDHDGGSSCRPPGHCCGPHVVSLTSGVEESKQGTIHPADGPRPTSSNHRSSHAGRTRGRKQRRGTKGIYSLLIQIGRGKGGRGDK
jgi:hypothetical protein